ncbi:DNA internalization-related competence protein ComEC/Rec2 [Nitrosomonas sp. ANs5]|uniref:DNA internalization-related competence protein ComEC/Rec2 n=1 Tax=Nitrosomonas sp. ANs5 TaxID=3423941 RepID=UPI003D338792
MPILKYSLAFVLGAILLQQQPQLPDMSLAAGWALTALLVLRLRRYRSGAALLANGFLLYGIVLGAGFLWAAFCAQTRLADALPHAWEGRDISLVGVVARMPQRDRQKIRFRFDVEQVLTPDATVPGRIVLSWYQGRQKTVHAPPDLRAGERWQLLVRLKRPHGNANPHVADYEAKLLERRVRAVGYVRPAPSNQRLEDWCGNLRYGFERMREHVRARFTHYLADSPDAGVLIALAVGDQRAIPAVHWQTFTRTGTNHLMAISGLHITLVSGLIAMAVYGLWRRIAWLSLRLPARKPAMLAGLIAALAYALLAGFAIPAQRAFLMLLIVVAACWHDRRVAMSAVLGWVLLVVVTGDPWAVIAPGFWLSFGAIALIGYALSGRIGQSGKAAGWVRIQWMITLGLFPLLLSLFQQVSLVSPIANALAIPVMTFAVVPLTLLAAVPGLEFCLSIALFILQGLMTGLQWLAESPPAIWQQHDPPAWTVAAAVAGVLWLMLPGGPGLGIRAGFPARWLGLLMLLPLFLVFPARPVEGELWLDVLDVGQGLAVVARTRHHAMLYDAGPSYGDSDSGKRIIVPYLRGEGIRALDLMIISHADSDHSGGALSVLQSVPTAALLASLGQDHPIRQKFADHRNCLAGIAWVWDGVHFEVLHPRQPSYLAQRHNTNESSCVLKITTRHGSVLLPADIGQPTESELLRQVPDRLPATVLIVPHHGSKSSSSQAFVHEVNPAYAIFTAGYRNPFGHPRAEVVNRYRALGSTLRRSDQDGAILLRFAQGGVEVNTWRALKRRYWHDRLFEEAQ